MGKGKKARVSRERDPDEDVEDRDDEFGDRDPASSSVEKSLYEVRLGIYYCYCFCSLLGLV